MKSLLILILILVSTVGFRIRGGLFNIGPHTFSRLAWAVPVGCGAALVSGNVYALAIIPTLFAACTVPTFHAIDMGRNEGTLEMDAFMNLVRGLIFGAAAAGPLWALGVLPLLNALLLLGVGVLMPAAYELGWRTPSVGHVKGLERGSAIAEAYWGAVFGLALGLALAV